MTLLSSGDSAELSDPVRQQQLLMAQLALACRHVHRVLEVLDSSLDRALCCTVFLNLPALLEPLGLRPDGPHWESIRATALRLLQTNCAAHKAKVEKRDADGDLDECSDQSDEEEEVRRHFQSLQFVVTDFIQAPQDVPVTVVGVSGLPRNALVEVEVLGCRVGSIPADLFNCDRSVEKQMTADVSSVAGEYTCFAQAKRLSRSVCVGFCEVSVSAQQPSSSSGSEPTIEVDSDRVALTLVSAISRAFAAADLVASLNLRTLRIYYLPDLCCESDLVVSMHKHLAEELQIPTAFPVLLVPAEALQEGVVLTAQFIGFDFVQLNAEVLFKTR